MSTRNETPRTIQTAPPLYLLPLAMYLLAGCKLPPAAPAETQVLVAVLDSSRSARAGDRCNEVEARLGATLSKQSAESIDVLVLGTGDDLEPTVIVPWRHFSPAERMYGDPAGEARERAVFTAELAARCRATLKASRRSPIFQAAKRGVEAVRAHCVELERDGGRCAAGPILAIHTDLHETEDPRLSQGLHKAKSGAAITPLPKINLSGIDVRVCGYAEYAGRTTGGDVVAVWREVLDDRATFDPVCQVEQHADQTEGKNQ